MTILAMLFIGFLNGLSRATLPPESPPTTVSSEQQPVAHHNNGAYYPDEQPTPPAHPAPTSTSTALGPLIRFVLGILQVATIVVYVAAGVWWMSRPKPKYKGYNPLAGIGFEL